jgi:hypothetical protein
MGRGTGIGLKDRARSMDVLRKLVSRCVPAGGQTEHEHIQHRRVAPGLGIRMRPASERPWVSQVPSVTPQTHPRRTLSVAILLKKGVLQCPLSEHMALLRSLSASRRPCPILRSFRLTEGKVGRQTRCVRSGRSHCRQPPKRRHSHCRGNLISSGMILRFHAKLGQCHRGC